jgi:hypothetical protein
MTTAIAFDVPTGLAAAASHAVSIPNQATHRSRT